MHDLVIRNAYICDGSGEPAFEGSVAVQGGRIAGVGPDVGRGTEEVDARGLALAPGLIDSHTHYDAQLTWDPTASPSLGLGVTTVVVGNCGFTIAPCKPMDRELTLKNLTQVEGMSLSALMTGTRWEFESVDDYLGALQRNGVTPNVAGYCGHSSLRLWVMGEAAHEREASDEEIEQMCGLLRQSLQAGALGFATSTNEPHNGWGGVPMPSRLADDREMRALANTLRDTGRGLFMLTKGAKTSIPYLESLAAENGRRMIIAAMVHDPSQPERVFDEMAEINEARSRGADLLAQVACTPLTQDFSLRGAYPFESRPHWKPAIRLYDDKEALARLYADPGFREGVKADLEVKLVTQFQKQWDKIDIVEVGRPEHAAYRMRNVAELAAEAGKHPLDWMLDFGLADDLETQFTVQLFNADEDAVLRLLRDPAGHVSLSDAGAHLSLLCDAGYGLHLLGRWVRERKDLGLEEAVKALTADQAAIYGLQRRGRIAPGYHADLLLFDPDTVNPGPKEAAHDLPGGAMRLVRKPVGVHGIWVNGARVADESGVFGPETRTGQVMREFAL